MALPARAGMEEITGERAGGQPARAGRPYRMDTLEALVSCRHTDAREGCDTFFSRYAGKKSGTYGVFVLMMMINHVRMCVLWGYIWTLRIGIGL